MKTFRHLEVYLGLGGENLFNSSLKMIPCSCLKVTYSHVDKSQPITMAVCTNYKQTKEWASLTLCGGCKVAQSCTRECQAADLPRHDCALFEIFILPKFHLEKHETAFYSCLVGGSYTDPALFIHFQFFSAVVTVNACGTTRRCSDKHFLHVD